MLHLSSRPATATSFRVTYYPEKARHRCCALRVSAGKSGFGEQSKRATEQPLSATTARKTKRLESIRQDIASSAPKPMPIPSRMTPDFKPVGDMSVFPIGKTTKVVELAGYGAVVLYQHQGQVYASDVQSTAYSFPLVDAKVIDGPAGEAAIEVPLDGTQYDLATGKVLKWCPSEGNLLRGLLSALKSRQSPVDLTVYKTAVDENGNIFVKVTTKK